MTFRAPPCSFVFRFAFSINRFPEFNGPKSILPLNGQEKKPTLKTKNKYIQSNIQNTLMLITTNITLARLN